MQLQNIQQQTTKHVEVYYECLLKLANCLHVKTINVFFTTISRANLLLHLKLAIAGMKRITLMEVVVICEESGPIKMSYNVVLTTPEANIVIKPIVVVATTKPSVQPIIVNEMVELIIN